MEPLLDRMVLRTVADFRVHIDFFFFSLNYSIEWGRTEIKTIFWPKSIYSVKNLNKRKKKS